MCCLGTLQFVSTYLNRIAFWYLKFYFVASVYCVSCINFHTTIRNNGENALRAHTKLADGSIWTYCSSPLYIILYYTNFKIFYECFKFQALTPNHSSFSRFTRNLYIRLSPIEANSIVYAHFCCKYNIINYYQILIIYYRL